MSLLISRLISTNSKIPCAIDDNHGDIIIYSRETQPPPKCHRQTKFSSTASCLLDRRGTRKQVIGSERGNNEQTNVRSTLHGIGSLLLFYKLVLYSSLLALIDCQQNPSIVHITPGQIVDLGDTVDLSCSVQYGSNYPIIWTKLSDNPNNPPLFISKDAALSVYDNRYSIRHDDSSSTYTLQVSKIQETDTGAYQCQVVTSATNRVTADTFISVRIPPLILDNGSSRGLIVGTGETFTLSCNATGVPEPKISWRRENNGLLPTGGTVAKGNSITIYNATKDDRGVYFCLADNSVGKTAKRSVGVEIEFAPQVNLLRARYQQAVGYPAELHCSIEASPVADISWLKEGYQINSFASPSGFDGDNGGGGGGGGGAQAAAAAAAAHPYHVSSSSNSHGFVQSTLRIRRVEQRDFGIYRCRAINKLGDRSASMQLERAAGNAPVCPPACSEGEYQSITTALSGARLLASPRPLGLLLACCSLLLIRLLV